MGDYVISCSSTADLSYEKMKERDISYCHFHFFMDGVQYDDDLGQTIKFDDFYKAMAEGADTKTSQLNSQDYLDYFRPILEEGKDILHVELSSGLSGASNSAEIAARELREEFPKRQIFIVDSLGASSGYGLIMDTLADMRDAGKDISELYDFAMKHRLNLHHWFFSTDLTFYIKGGRVSKTAGFFGNLLNICPLLNMDAPGHLVPREKIRTKKKVKKIIVDRMAEHAEGGLNYSGKCFISHSACVEDAQDVAMDIEERFKHLNGPVEIYSIGTTIGSHTGPGTVAVFFWGDDRN